MASLYKHMGKLQRTVTLILRCESKFHFQEISRYDPFCMLVSIICRECFPRVKHYFTLNPFFKQANTLSRKIVRKNYTVLCAIYSAGLYLYISTGLRQPRERVKFGHRYLSEKVARSLIIMYSLDTGV